ncbi:MAG: Fe-S cluster assembly protein SufD [Verrucomicrobia bacterium]|nr:Fe-S cluster assembly protein SufD [Verrucomicrobiota bacterium]
MAAHPTPAVNEPGAYVEKFDRFQKSAHDPSWLHAARQAAMGRFAARGFPTLQDEDWRFTSLAPLAKLPFRPVLKANLGTLASDTLSTLPFAGLQGSCLVFVDGHFAPTLSTIAASGDAIRIGSLAQVLNTSPALLEPRLSPSAPDGETPFAALNAAFFQDGAFVHLPPQHVLPEPVHAVFISAAASAGSTAHPRNLILAEAGSRMTFVETHVSLAGAGHLTNAVTELAVGDGAQVEHVKFQDQGRQAFHLATLRSTLGRDSRLRVHSIATGARLSRNNIDTRLAGPGLECLLNGLYLTRGEQLADHHMTVDHAEPRGASHEYFNGILADRSKGVFHGRILVRPGAQQTDAKQTNKNLLLSDEATVNTKPQLEIYADDVRCTHGATVGQLNAESIFYCRARGIGLETARHMLIHAFAGEIIGRILHAGVREELDRLIWQRLEQHPLVGQPHAPHP